MAVQIPNTLYTGGNVEFDSTPSVKFYQQIEAERRAKQDAIDDYMRGLRGKVTPAGMRVADLPAFDTMRKKWQEFGVQNRDRIARDPQARAEFESMAQDLVSFAEESKAEEAAKKPFVELMTDPNKRQRVRPEVFGMISEHDKPLYTTDAEGNLVRDYSRKKIDYTSKLFKDPEFDFQKEYKGWIGDIKPSEVIELDKPYTDKQTGMVFFPSKEKYNKEQVAQVGRNAVRAVKDDEDKFQYYADRMAAITQKEYEQLDNIYRKYYNEPIGTSPEKLAAAEAAAAAEQQIRDLKPVSKLDYEGRKADRPVSIRFSQGGGAATSGTNVNELYTRIGQSVDNAAKEYKTRPGSGTLNRAASVQEMPFDESNLIVEFVNKSYPNKGAGDMPYKASELYLLRGDDGKIRVYSSNENLIGVLPEIATNLKVQPDVKAKRTVVGRGEQTKTETKTFTFPNGKTKF